MFYYHPPKINNVQDRLLHENEIIENILYKIVLKADFIQLYLEDWQTCTFGEYFQPWYDDGGVSSSFITLFNLNEGSIAFSTISEIIF